MKTSKQPRRRLILYLAPAVFALLVGSVGARLLSAGHAATLNYTANQTWDQNRCSVLVNNDVLQYYGVANGDSLNVTVHNQTQFILNVNFTGDANHGGQNGPYNVNPGDSVNVPFTNLQADANVTVNGNGCGGATNSSVLRIQVGSATLSCSTVPSGKMWAWNVTGSYTGAISGAIYNGSDLAGATGGGDGMINQTYAAGSSATTFYYYDGNDSSGRLLAQVNCAGGSYPSATAAPTPSTAATTKTAVTSPTANQTVPANATDNNTASTSSTPTSNLAAGSHISSTTKPKRSSKSLALISLTVLAFMSGLGWVLVKQQIIKLPGRKR